MLTSRLAIESIPDLITISYMQITLINKVTETHSMASGCCCGHSVFNMTQHLPELQGVFFQESPDKIDAAPYKGEVFTVSNIAL